jgi:hypothetical protein
MWPVDFFFRSFKRQREYLKPGRLEDLLVLIRILGLGERDGIYGGTLQKELQQPDSAESWVEVARSHREFFRVTGENQDYIALVARAYNRGPDKGHRLSDELVQKLIEMAIDIHDRYLARSDRWKVFVPILVAVIGTVGALLSNWLVKRFE